MNVSDASRILKVLSLMEQMPIVGEGETTPTIVFYSGVTHSTTYRYMPKLEKLGLVTCTKIVNRANIEVRYYKITEMGKGYVLDERKLL